MDKAALLALMASEIREVKVEALDAMLKFKVMTGKARDAFQKAVEAGDKSFSHFEASIITATVVDDNGAAMFDADDISALRDQDSKALSAVAAVAMDVNKIGAKSQDDAAKN